MIYTRGQVSVDGERTKWLIGESRARPVFRILLPLAKLMLTFSTIEMSGVAPGQSRRCDDIMQDSKIASPKCS